MKVYISGKITGTNDYMKRFEDAEIELQLNGYDVINPALVNSNLPECTTHDEYMKISLCMLDMCDAIYMLDGWNNSKGACIEYGYALGKDKVFLRK